MRAGRGRRGTREGRVRRSRPRVRECWWDVAHAFVDTVYHLSGLNADLRETLHGTSAVWRAHGRSTCMHAIGGGVRSRFNRPPDSNSNLLRRCDCGDIALAFAWHRHGACSFGSFSSTAADTALCTNSTLEHLPLACVSLRVGDDAPEAGLSVMQRDSPPPRPILLRSKNLRLGTAWHSWHPHRRQDTTDQSSAYPPGALLTSTS